MTTLERICAACAILAIVVLVSATLAWGHSEQSTIGGTSVPALNCEEDEAIWWVGIDTLACVHADEI